MNNSKALFQDLVDRIAIPEDQDEIRSAAIIILDNLFSVSPTDIFSEKKISVSQSDRDRLNTIVERLNAGEPLQYILGESQFYGRKFSVGPAVLIPRPETEELVHEVKAYAASEGLTSPKVLDIGTGSGCIAVTLKLELRASSVFATDVSGEALSTARRNSRDLNAPVTFMQSDILSDEIPVAALDIITSNPPYVTQAEAQTMKKNVVAFEPHLALFVPDDDPLLFYRSISAKAFAVLNPGGLLAVEVSERSGREVASLLSRTGYRSVEVVQDINSKDRIITGIKPEN